MSKEEAICNSCGVALAQEGSTLFKCPECGDTSIGRCPRCRDQSVVYECPSCKMKGP